MTEAERDVLIESAVSAHRERAVEGHLLAAPAWWDLPADAREALAARQAEVRRFEAALHVRGWNGTVRAVMARIARG